MVKIFNYQNTYLNYSKFVSTMRLDKSKNYILQLEREKQSIINYKLIKLKLFST